MTILFPFDRILLIEYHVEREEYVFYGRRERRSSAVSRLDNGKRNVRPGVGGAMPAMAATM